MTRKMQMNSNKAQASVVPSAEIVNLMLTMSAMALIVATIIIMLFIAPANASHLGHQSHGELASKITHAVDHKIAHEPLTVWAEGLPTGFQAQSAAIGLDVVSVNSLPALGAYVVTLKSVQDLHPSTAFQVLSDTFPSFEFKFLDDDGADLKLVLN